MFADFPIRGVRESPDDRRPSLILGPQPGRRQTWVRILLRLEERTGRARGLGVHRSGVEGSCLEQRGSTPQALEFPTAAGL